MQSKQSINLADVFLSLAYAMDLCSPELSSHQLRTAFISWEIAGAAGRSQESIERIFATAMLHDIGALSPEEKLSLHNNETFNTEPHCILGEILFNYVPLLHSSAKIVRHHHTRYVEMDGLADDDTVFESQVIHLADVLERSITKKKFILHQNEDLTAKIVSLSGKDIHPEVVQFFLETSGREEFWLDVMNQRLYSQLLAEGPFRLREVALQEIGSISELFRHVIDFRSNFTATHSTGVSTCAASLAELYGLSNAEVWEMEIAGNFHDLGKLAVPNCILEKPGKLTAEEYAVMRQHTYYTYAILNSVRGLEEIAEWGAYHHEKLDGSGYPFHLNMDQLKTGARIMMVADIFTALGEDRPYRKRLGKDTLTGIIKKQADEGKLDSRVTDVLFDNYDVVYTRTQEKQVQAFDYYKQKFASLKQKISSDKK